MVWSASDTDVTMALTRHEHLAVLVRIESNSPPRCAILGDGANGRARGRHHLQAFELMVVELVGILDRRQVRRVDEEKGAPH